jgi:arylsulfatase A-like enzyme
MTATPAAASTKGKPNVILILADDMGFADLGVTGSEIETPNIDGLAERGILFSSMYNCARCCPTRASLLTGLYPHNAGVGHMGTNLGTPAYQGFLRNDCVTIAEVLKTAGYRTLMSGKWHVGGDFDPRDADTWKVGDVGHPMPRQRGFDRFYGIVDGATHFFSPHYVMEDDARIEVDPTGYYFTDAITDNAITMMEEASADASPFFLYLAHAAPHWPLHAYPEDIAKYDGVYSKGWDAIRGARHERMNATGVFQHTFDISPRDADARPWSAVHNPDWEAARMATYAAMVDRMDQSIGRVVATLKRLGEYDNTLILFLSDNGGCAEFLAEDGWAKFYPEHHLDGRPIVMGNRSDQVPGDPLTFMSYDLPWANASNAPFRLFKHWVHEGGISTPLVAHWPDGIPAPHITHAATHVVDVLPTILEVTGARYPSELGGHAIQPMDGVSFRAALNGKDWQREQPIYWEHEGNAAVRLGQFKLVRQSGRPWELYDMEVDRTELNCLAGKHKPLEEQLRRDFEAWAQLVGVEPWDLIWPKLKAAWGLESVGG